MIQIDSMALFTLKRQDGEEKTIQFEDEPGWILIKASTDPSGRITPRITDHDRLDFNDRARQAWGRRMWIWLKEEMAAFSNKKNVWAFYQNPFKAIGGCVPDV